MTWILKADDIANLLDMSKAIEITEAAFHEQAAGLTAKYMAREDSKRVGLWGPGITQSASCGE
jgi:ornithine cyclodeaminase/alanine dehydrogenase-like protein (mu-crystallin family)